MLRSVAGLYRRAYEGLPAEIWVISFALFVNRLGTMVLPFLTIYLTSQLHYGEAAAGRFMSIYGIGSIFGVFVAGRLMRVVGTVRMQICLFLLACPAFLMVPLFSSPVGLAISLFLLGGICDAVRPANNTAISQFAPRELRVRAFGLQRMALNLGFSFGPAVGGIMATYSFLWLFYLDAFTCVLCALVLGAYFGFGTDTFAKASAEKLDKKTTKSVSPLTDTQFVVFLLLLLLTSVAFFQFMSTYPLYLTQHYGFTKPMLGRLYAVNTLVVVIAEMVVLQTIKRWNLLTVMSVGTFLSSVGFGMLPFGNSVIFAVFSMLVITLGEMLWMPLAAGWIALRAERGDEGRYMSWYTATYSVAMMAAPTIGGAIYERSAHWVWYACLSVSVVVLVGFNLLRRTVDHAEKLEFAG